jgi:protein tyrosine phosphatase (PTP) superfamily phosphohydrolase (DUF442 family)
MTENADLDRIESFLEISEKLGTAGQPFREEFPLIQKAGYKTVINLAMPDSMDAISGEPELVKELGLDYIAIPVVWERPMREDLQKFFAEMDRLQGEKIFVHCARNMRVSAFVYLYLVLRQGVDQDTARETMETIWEPNATWQKFIDEALSSPDFPARAPSPDSLAPH